MKLITKIWMPVLASVFSLLAISTATLRAQDDESRTLTRLILTVAANEVNQQTPMAIGMGFDLVETTITDSAFVWDIQGADDVVSAVKTLTALADTDLSADIINGMIKSGGESALMIYMCVKAELDIHLIFKGKDSGESITYVCTKEDLKARLNEEYTDEELEALLLKVITSSLGQ